MCPNPQRIKRSLLVAVCVASLSMVDTANAEFWFEDFADGILSDGGIDWRFSDKFGQTYDISSDGLEVRTPSTCCSAATIADWPPDRQGWSIRTRGRLLQDHGFFGAGISRLLVGDEYAWNLVAADGVTTVGVQQTAGDLVETDLKPFTEDVTVQLDSFDGVLRMWAWRDNEQPSIDSPPLVEDIYDVFDAYPMVTAASFDGPSGALLTWVAISTEHIPLNMDVPLSDLVGDFSGNDILDIADIDLLADAIQSGKVDLPFNLNHDGAVDLEDHTFWITNIYQTWIGDANLDGEFNSGDFVTVFQAGRYETDEIASWSDGDWNADGVFSSSDLVTAFEDGGYEMGARGTAVAAVPEPSAAILLLLGLFSISRIRKHS